MNGHCGISIWTILRHEINKEWCRTSITLNNICNNHCQLLSLLTKWTFHGVLFPVIASLLHPGWVGTIIAAFKFDQFWDMKSQQRMVQNKHQIEQHLQQLLSVVFFVDQLNFSWCFAPCDCKSFGWNSHWRMWIWSILRNEINKEHGAEQASHWTMSSPIIVSCFFLLTNWTFHGVCSMWLQVFSSSSGWNSHCRMWIWSILMNEIKKEWQRTNMKMNKIFHNHCQLFSSLTNWTFHCVLFNEISSICIHEGLEQLLQNFNLVNFDQENCKQINFWTKCFHETIEASNGNRIWWQFCSQ